MREKVLYECMQCGKTFIEEYKDGLSCCKCKEALKPLGYVDKIKKDISTMQDKLNKASKLTEKKEAQTLTIKLDLDTTEFEKKLNRLKESLKEINKHTLPKTQVTTQEINKLMTETLTKANETISMIAKEFMNISKEV